MAFINLSSLLKLLSQIPTYQTLADALHTDALTPVMRQPWGVLTAARPALLAALHADLQRPVCFITARADRARVLAEQTQIWSAQPEQVHRLPDPDALPHEKVSWSNDTIQHRLTALSALVAQTPPPLIITSARALMHQTLPPGEFNLMQLRIGQQIKLDEVLSQWIAWGYQPEEVVEVPGSLSRRGGILDIYPPNVAQPIRIELFGDEIESLRSFDPITQRSEAQLQAFTVGPASEALPCHAPHVADTLNQWNLDNLQPSTRMELEEDIARLASGTNFRGIEYYLPFLYNGTQPIATILDYLPPNTLLIIEDPEELALVVSDVDTQARTLKKDLSNIGDLPAEWPDPYLSWEQLAPMLNAREPIVFGFTALRHTDPITDKSPYYVQSLFAAAPAFGGQVKTVMEDVSKRKQHGERIVMVSRQTNRLTNLLEEQVNTRVAPVDGLPFSDPPPPSGSVTLVQGVLAEGWSLPTDDNAALLTLMSDSEIFGWKKPTTVRRRQPRRGMTPETFFADVNPGDFVVHIEHGIGRYIGLARLNFEGVEREYLEVQYANSDKLYIPIHQADRLARYVGPEDIRPPLNRLGSTDWATVKRKAKRAVEDIAKELLEIYAKREVVPGRAFASDSDWQREIEDSFPFVETDDQLRAIEDTKKDMEKARPMDRLVCGDVGYGKTEVALRAAFKAVMDGSQVAILVPTTILAQQHYQTFKQRMANYPIQIETLSRLRTKSQQERTIANIASGTTDIVIGTHRLLQKDIVFKDLGLLIIDEEQRFGVKHKEKFKSMRATIDVLTLTATPIPRTLHMAISGVRDLSTIDTPPEERLPIQTSIAEYDEELIRTAVMRELDRGGQVFYVYNRVMGIEQKANRLRNIMPEVRVVVAHGQMRERELERAMIAFVAGEYDVLVSTTIIENGLDMPNVNTIIIDRADRLGLAQLHQLRGRVGRGAVRAYAYMLTPKNHELNRDAKKRLEAIAESTELGAGFRLAMRDLEIRGAGDLLGSKQHGQIAAVGFDLYTRLLTQSIQEIKGLVGESDDLTDEAAAYLTPLSDSVQLNLPIPAYVPESYLPEEKLRLRLYRRVAGLTTLQGIDDMAKELEDRFGEMPEPVANLLYQLKLKVLAMQAEVKAIVTEMGQIVIRADNLQELDREGLHRRLSTATKVTPRQVFLPLHPDPTVWQGELEKALRLIARMLHDPSR